MFQKVYMLKISIILCLGFFHLLGQLTGLAIFKNLDIWLVSILFLVFRLWANLTKSKETSLLERPAGSLKAYQEHEIALVVNRLLEFHKKSRLSKKPDFRLIHYMKRHTLHCRDIYCPCRRITKDYDFLKNKKYRKEYNEVDSETEQAKKLVIAERAPDPLSPTQETYLTSLRVIDLGEGAQNERGRREGGPEFNSLLDINTKSQSTGASNNQVQNRRREIGSTHMAEKGLFSAKLGKNSTTKGILKGGVVGSDFGEKQSMAKPGSTRRWRGP